MAFYLVSFSFALYVVFLATWSAVDRGSDVGRHVAGRAWIP